MNKILKKIQKKLTSPKDGLKTNHKPNIINICQNLSTKKLKEFDNLLSEIPYIQGVSQKFSSVIRLLTKTF